MTAAEFRPPPGRRTAVIGDKILATAGRRVCDISYGHWKADYRLSTLRLPALELRLPWAAERIVRRDS